MLGSRPRPPALAPNLYLPALAPNLYLSAPDPNLCLPALAPNSYLPTLLPNLHLYPCQDFTTINTATCTIPTTTTTTTTTTNTTANNNNNNNTTRDAFAAAKSGLNGLKMYLMKNLGPVSVNLLVQWTTCP